MPSRPSPGKRGSHRNYCRSASQKGIDMCASTARSAGPVLVSRRRVSTFNSKGRACGERVGRVHAVPQASSRPCPAHRSRL